MTLIKPTLKLVDSGLSNDPVLFGQNIEYFVDSFLKRHREYVDRRDYLMGVVTGAAKAYEALKEERGTSIGEAIDKVDKLLRLGIDALTLYEKLKKKSN